ncbi:hypothetical protein CHUAL_013796 [Chamberlinius hualienensis]
MANPYASEMALFIFGTYMIISIISHSNLFEPQHMRGKVVLLTDSDSIIGRQMAIEFSKMNAKIFTIGENESSLASLAKDCLIAGAGDAVTLKGHIKSADIRQMLMSKIESHYGRLDYLIINHDESNIDEKVNWNNTEKLRDAVSYYVTSNVELAGMALPLLQRNRGYIGIVSEMPGKISLPNLSAVSASKAAIQTYFTSVRQELKRSDAFVSVTTVTLAYIEEVDGSKVEGRWGKLFEGWGSVTLEDAASHAVYAIGGRKKDVTYPFAAQFHSIIHRWFLSLFEDPNMPNLTHLLPQIPLISAY